MPLRTFRSASSSSSTLVGSKNTVIDPFRFASRHATAILIMGASNHFDLPSFTCHKFFTQASNPHLPFTNARHVA